MKNISSGPLRGLPRIRYWVAAVPTAYVILNILAIIMMMAGANAFVPHPFWHAPILWVFG
jgi:hypothetical protein